MEERIRREPPAFRAATVLAAERRGARLKRITLAGPELVGFEVGEPAASVRVLLPPPGRSELVLPRWDGNVWLLPDGSRAPIRTLTPRHADPTSGELVVEVVQHGRGVASEWAGAAEPGAATAISGPARGYTVDTGAGAFLLAGDETAIPAISQLLEVLPPTASVAVHIEIADDDGRVDLPRHPSAAVEWHVAPNGEVPGTALVAAVVAAAIPDGAPVWVAGEAAAVQRVRKHLFEERGLPRSQATVRGYWKHGRGGE